MSKNFGPSEESVLLNFLITYLWSGGRLKGVPVVTENIEHNKRLELVWIIVNQSNIIDKDKNKKTKKQKKKGENTAVN